VAFSRLSLALALKPRFVKADGICVWPPLALALYYRLLSINNSIVGKIIKHLMIGLRLRILRQSELLRPPVAQACLLHSRTAPHRPPRPTIHPSHASQPRVPATHPSHASQTTPLLLSSRASAFPLLWDGFLISFVFG
jgi:hypothetical protein